MVLGLRDRGGQAEGATQVKRRGIAALLILAAVVTLLPTAAFGLLTSSVGVGGNTFTAVTLSPPTAVTATCNGLGSIRISWTAAAYASGYRIYRSASGGAQDVLLNTGAPDTASPYDDNSSFALLTTYTYRVKSVRGTNWISGAFSNTSAGHSMTLFVCV